MKKALLLLIILGGLVFAKDVNAQVGCCTGTVTEGEIFCPNDPDPNNWYCTNTRTVSGCGGLDYSTCINTRPTGGVNYCTGTVTCTGCGWSTTACGGDGGGGGGGNGEPCSSNGDCASGRCSQSRGICVNPPDGGGDQCDLSYANCPPGTTRGSTVVGSQCAQSNCTAGSAQIQGDCCRDVVIAPASCGDWYDKNYSLANTCLAMTSR